VSKEEIGRVCLQPDSDSSGEGGMRR